MGADRAIQICTDQELEPLDIARILVRLAETESPDLILLGKQAIDGDNNQTGQMLAALWDRPQGTFVSELTISENKATVVREVDSGLETLELDLPAVITSDLRLNEPRYVKMPDIMKAKRKPLDVSNIEDLGVSVESRVRIVTTEAPPPRQKGKIVADVGELVAELRKRDLA
jgi:electron transfer flavoprotein beta subunit